MLIQASAALRSTAVYMELPLNTIQTVQWVQGTTVYALSKTRAVIMTLILRDDNWLPVRIWVHFEVYVITVKALHNYVPYHQCKPVRRLALIFA